MGDAHIKHTQLDDFDTVENVEASLLNSTIIEWGFQANITKEVILFNTQVQPSFNRQFQLLIANLQEHEKRGMPYLFLQSKPSSWSVCMLFSQT